MAEVIVLRSSTPKTKQLEVMFGGKWSYCRPASEWRADDNRRMVCAVSMCGCDDTCIHPPTYWLYGDGTPKRVDFFSKGIF